MPFPDIDPIWFSIGPIPIRWYALAYVAGIVLGWWYAAKLVKTESIWAPGRPPLNIRQLDDLVLWVTLAIILGGRLGYALFYNPGLYGALFTGDTLGERLALFRLWDGGMSFHGGMIGCTLAVFLFARQTKASVLSIGDMALAAAPFGLFFGRMANFINGELWGRVTDVPWAVRFCNNTIIELHGGCPAGDLPRHPSQLYEATLEGLVLFAVLWLAIWKAKLLTKPGYVTGLFLFGYGLSRALLETVREPDSQMPEFLRGTVTMGMLLSIPMMLVGAWLVYRAWSRPPVTAAS